MIFVTGGTGMLGAHLLFELSRENEHIRALYRSTAKINQVRSLFKFYNPDDWKTQFDRIKWVEGDILDIPLLIEQIEGSTNVYHCAALVSFHPKDFNALIKVNREGTENVVNACLHHHVDKLCYVSSTAAIGGLSGATIDENTKWKNIPDTSGYSTTKYSAERAVWRGIEEGLKAVIVNPCVILGAGNWNESSLTIFKTVQKGIRFFPPGSNATVDARDVATIMVRLMQSEIHSERYLCIGSNQSFKELMTVIANEIGVRAPSKKVSRALVTFVRRIKSFFAWISGSRSNITKETVDSLFNNKAYSNAKISEALNFTFRDLQEQVRNGVAGRIV
ncbi:MAG: NAD-dependent epimerase/dehydratase family protein [Crocinitomicaceae bacterium]|nr:NAD-dependent epimerase/dehydratase family protein [Crocinitomicaceae bacterium]